MINLLDAIEQYKGTNPQLWLTFFKFAAVIEEHERRIRVAETQLDKIKSFGSLALVSASAGQAVSGWTTINFTQELFDQDNLHDPAANSHIMNIKNSGVYFLFACGELEPPGFGSMVGAIRVNILTTSAQDLVLRGTYGTDIYGHVVVGIRHLRSNARLEVQMYSDFATNTVVSPNNTRPYFGVFRLPFDVDADFSGVPF